MPLFLHYFTSTRVYASVEQMETRLLKIFAPFDPELHNAVGLSASRMCELIKGVTSHLQERADAAREEAVSMYTRGAFNAIMSGSTGSQDFPSVSELQRSMLSSLKVSRVDLASRWGERDATLFWDLFVTIRGASAQITYLTEKNPVELKPLLSHQDGEAYLPMGNVLYYAAQKLFGAYLEQGSTRAAFLKRRDDFLEERAEAAFRSFLGDSAKIWTNVCEQPDTRYEHDLIVAWQRVLFVVEAKAGQVKEPFRDADKAYPRIVSNFKEVVQKGYDQANQVRKLLLEGKDVPLYDLSNGKRVATLCPGDFDRLYCICVTSDSFGPLAGDLHLLKRANGEEYPWVVTYYDLESFFEALAYRKWTGAEFCRFLDDRLALYDRLVCSDELDVAGIFITHGSLDALLQTDLDQLVLDGSTSTVFDDIWTEKQGGSTADLTPRITFTNLEPRGWI
jgi:hypothetical protein